jgi:hypothetical protein
VLPRVTGPNFEAGTDGVSVEERLRFLLQGFRGVLNIMVKNGSEVD